MASKLYRYIYSDKILPLKYYKKQPAGMGMTRHMGYYGQQILLQEDDKLPLIGQIATVCIILYIYIREKIKDIKG